MKIKEELEALKEECIRLSNKFAELSEEGLEQVSGGCIGEMDSVFESVVAWRGKGAAG